MELEPGRILVLGTGYVASAYLRALHFLGLRPAVLSRAWLDYTDPDVFENFLTVSKPQLVINAAGFTGRTVDDCEADKQQCYAANVTLARTIGEACARAGIALAHISSGCIFTGLGPFKESDEPNNLSQFYAQCKWHAELELAKIGGKVWTFRIRMPFGNLPHPRNLLTKLANYERILDGLNTLTFLDEFAMRSYQLMGKAAPGVYHAGCSLSTSTALVAQMLLEAGIRKVPVKLYPPDEFLKTHVARSYAVLDVSKFEGAYGTKFGDPLVALRWCIQNFGIARARLPGAG